MQKEYKAAESSDVANYLASGEYEKFNGMTAIFHLRFATQGAVTYKNTHPFKLDKWAFAHDGHVETLNPTSQPIGDTDSELAFYYLYEKIQQMQVWEALHETIQLAGYGFNFLLAHDNDLYAYWSALAKLYRAKGQRGWLIASEKIKGIKQTWEQFQENELIHFSSGKIQKKEIISCLKQQ